MGTVEVDQNEKGKPRFPKKEGIAVESSPSVKGQLGVIAKRDYKKENAALLTRR
jgi:hypothetical protein